MARFAWIALTLLLGLTATSALVKGQDAEAPADAVYLTGGLISETAAGPVYYRTSTDVPTKAAFEKAYQATSLVGAAYQTRFTYVPAADLEVSGPLVAKIWVSCDLAMAYTHGQSPQPSSTFNILRGTAAVAGTTVNRYDAGVACTGPSSITAITY